MSLEDVKDEILRKAKKEAEAILKEAKKEEETILAKADEDAAALKKAKEETLKKELALMKKKAEAANELEAKKAVLTERKNLIDKTFELANDKLRKVPKDEMKKKINVLIKKAGTEIDIGVIYCNKKDTGFIEGTRKESGITGGIIAESKDGNVSVDLCFETLLEEIKDKHTEEISSMLFK